MKNINLRGQNFEYPETLDTEWGDEATTFASAVGDVINRIAPTTDTLDTKVSLIEDGTLRIIPGLLLDNTKINAADITLVISRSGGSFEGRENFSLEAFYNETLSLWEMAISSVGDSGVVLEIDSSGQVKYTAQPTGATTFFARYRFNGFGN